MENGARLERRAFIGACAGAALCMRPAWGQAARAPEGKLIDDLVAANRILADQGVVDGFGHVSVRHDKRPDRFLLSRSMAPGLVTEADILEMNMDGAAVDAQGKALYAERFIHSEIYRARPDVGAIVHSHAPDVIAFGVSKQPLLPTYHMAAFLGAGAPVFEIRDAGGVETDILVRTPALGKALAATLGKHSVVLMRGHGYVAIGSNVRTAVMHAIYTRTDAQIQSDAMRLGQVTYLNEAEAAKASATMDGLVDRAWEIWRAAAMGK